MVYRVGRLVVVGVAFSVGGWESDQGVDAVTCPFCGETTREDLNACQKCRRWLPGRLEAVKLGKGTQNVRSIEKFWETGDPAVFSKPGDPDYDPRVAA